MLEGKIRGSVIFLLNVQNKMDATIQRFEFCFELSWRLMRSVLAYEGIDISTQRGTIREGWKLGERV